MNRFRSCFTLAALVAPVRTRGSGAVPPGVILWALLLAGSLSAQELPVRGGPGGAAFRQQCGEREYLVGLAVRGGSWVDAIRITCAPLVLRGYHVGEPAAGGAFAGGRGGILRDVRCSGRDQAVSGIGFSVTESFGTLSVSDPQLVTGLRFTCSALEPPHAPAGEPLDVLTTELFFASAPSGAFSTGRDVRFFPVQTCPSGTLAVGLHGRAGEYVDALGLICGPAPAPFAAMGPSKRTTAADLGQEEVGGKVSGTRSVPPKKAGGVPKPDRITPRKVPAKAPAGEPVPPPAGSPAPAEIPANPPATPPGDPAAPPVVEAGATTTFENPTNPAGARLNVCLDLPNRQCGEPAARTFCEAKGHTSVAAFSTEVLKGGSSTWGGRACRSGNCEAFKSITCRS